MLGDRAGYGLGSFIYLIDEVGDMDRALTLREWTQLRMPAPEPAAGDAGGGGEQGGPEE